MGWIKEPYIKVLYVEYYVRRLNHRSFSVAKFLNGSEQPQAVYTLTERREGLQCDCFGGIVHNPYACKHVPMVMSFLESPTAPYCLLQGKEAV